MAMTQQAQAEALELARELTLLSAIQDARFPNFSDVANDAAELRRLHARAQELAEKAAKYDHLLPYLCKTCGGFGLVDRRIHDDPLGSEPCPDCNAPTQERNPLARDKVDACWDGRMPSGAGKSRYDITRDIERAHGIGVETK